MKSRARCNKLSKWYPKWYKLQSGRRNISGLCEICQFKLSWFCQIKTYELLFEVGLLSQRSHWSHCIWQSPCTAEKRKVWWSCQMHLFAAETKHSQQVLRCSWLHFLELNNSQWFFLLKASGDKQSLIHPSEGTCFRLIIHSSMAFLSTTHSATYFGNLPPSSAHGGYHCRSEIGSLWGK